MNPNEPSFSTISPRVYPIIEIVPIQNPKRFYAVPVVGGLFKFIILLPQFLMLGLMGFFVGIGLLINVFVVLFTGKYWRPAYQWIVYYAELQAKITFFQTGLTNRYPWFKLAIQDSYKVNVPYPVIPNRLYAVPLFGFLIRLVLMIPFLIFSSILNNAVVLMTTASSIIVLFRGYYPESTFELVRDTTRVELASFLYFAGISDTYPTFKISMNHKILKVVFIVLGTLWFILGMINSSPEGGSSKTKFDSVNSIGY